MGKNMFDRYKKQVVVSMGTREENLDNVRFIEDELFVLDARGLLEN